MDSSALSHSPGGVPDRYPSRYCSQQLLTKKKMLGGWHPFLERCVSSVPRHCPRTVAASLFHARNNFAPQDSRTTVWVCSRTSRVGR